MLLFALSAFASSAFAQFIDPAMQAPVPMGCMPGQPCPNGMANPMMPNPMMPNPMMPNPMMPGVGMPPMMTPDGRFNISVVASNFNGFGNYKCNGFNDQVQIQMAINQIGQTGGTLTLSEGTFYVAGPITLYSNLNIRGAGQDRTRIVVAGFNGQMSNMPVFANQINPMDNGLMPGQLPIGQPNIAPGMPIVSGVAQSMASAGSITNQALFIGNNVQNVQLNEFAAIGARKNSTTMPLQHGVFFEGCSNMRLNRLRMEGFSASGYGSHNSQGVIFDNCYAGDNGSDGFFMETDKESAVQNCYIERNGRHGVNILGGSVGIRVQGSTSNNNGFYSSNVQGCGINVQSSAGSGSGAPGNTQNINIDNNQINNNAGPGIYVTQTTNTKVTNNRINNNQNVNCMVIIGTINEIHQGNSCWNGWGVRAENNQNFFNSAVTASFGFGLFTAMALML